MWGIISSSPLRHSYHTVRFQTRYFMHYMLHFYVKLQIFFNEKFSSVVKSIHKHH